MYRITVWHGEHRSLFYVIKLDNDGEWEVVHTAESKVLAERFINEHKQTSI